MLRWPDRDTVLTAARQWAGEQARHHPGLLAIGCYGSYARGDSGVGSDLDVIAIVRASDAPFERRAVAWDLAGLPVPADLLVYTRDEWERLGRAGGRFARMLREETMWLWVRDGEEGLCEGLAQNSAVAGDGGRQAPGNLGSAARGRARGSSWMGKQPGYRAICLPPTDLVYAPVQVTCRTVNSA